MILMAFECLMFKNMSFNEAQIFYFTNKRSKAEGRNRFKVYSPHNAPEEFSPQKSLALLKEDLNRILEKTRNSAIASLQLLAKNIAGSEHQAPYCQCFSLCGPARRAHWFA